MADAPMIMKVRPLVWREAPSVLRGMEYVSECRTYYLRRNRGSYQVERNGNPVSGAISHAEAIIFADNDNASRILAAIDVAPDQRVTTLVEAARPYVSPVQNADYARQLRQHDALVAALAAFREGAQ